MQPDRARGTRIRVQLVSAVLLILVLVASAVLHSAGRSAGEIAAEIAAALVLVALIMLAVRRSLGANSATLADLRRSEPLSYACYFENRTRGTLSVIGGELVLRRFKGRKLVESGRLAVATYAITPARVQLAPARQVDGLAVTDGHPGGSAVRAALSQDTITLVGSTLKGPELEDAIERLRAAAAAPGPAR